MTAITVDSFLVALRLKESGGNYTAANPFSTASGAYQYTDSTWNHYGGYARAKDAPAPTQDARARADVTARLVAYHGDWAKVAAAHFAGSGWVAKHPDPSTWNQNPVPGSNNPTVSAYVSGVLKAAGDPAAAKALTKAAPAGGTGGATATGGASRPNDWIGAIDLILNPTPPKGGSGLLNAVTLGAADLPSEIGYVVQLVGARAGFAMVGLILLGAGLALALGPEILAHPDAALALVAPEAAGVADLVKHVTTTTEKTDTGGTVKHTTTHHEEKAA